MDIKLANIYTFEDSGTSQWKYCVSFSIPCFEWQNKVKEWCDKINTTNRMDHIDTSCMRWGEVWFDEEQYATMFMIKWA